MTAVSESTGKSISTEHYATTLSALGTIGVAIAIIGGIIAMQGQTLAAVVAGYVVLGIGGTLAVASFVALVVLYCKAPPKVKAEEPPRVEEKKEPERDLSLLTKLQVGAPFTRVKASSDGTQKTGYYSLVLRLDITSDELSPNKIIDVLAKAIETLDHELKGRCLYIFELFTPRDPSITKVADLKAEEILDGLLNECPKIINISENSEALLDKDTITARENNALESLPKGEIDYAMGASKFEQAHKAAPPIIGSKLRFFKDIKFEAEKKE